jgi:SSS family solute:Na+ symporter
VVYGMLGTGVALWMIQAKTVLDVWWKLAGIFSGGVLGLFLLGMLSRRAGNAAGAIGTVVGVLLILWMTLSDMGRWQWPLRSPFHSFLTIVFGTLAILVIGFATAQLIPGKRTDPERGETRLSAESEG